MSHPNEETVLIADTEASERLDRVLAARIERLSRTRLKALILDGEVTIGARTIRDPGYRVNSGETVSVRIPPPLPATPEGEDIPLTVVFEDDQLIVIEKPAGLVVHPAAGNWTGTLVNALIAHCGDSLSGIGGVKRPGIVHRLDKDTTGIMVVAKNDAAHHHLARQFAERSVERMYLALVWGLPSPMEGTISGAIGRDPRDRKRMALVEGRGKPAQTRYAVLRAYGVAAALLSCRLLTGRTHQIRVHLASIGHPLIGDPTYGRVTAARLKRLPEPAQDLARAFPRQALHAAVLGFEHPSSGQSLRFETEPPVDMLQILNTLESLQKINYT